jgi:hypothetical protein
MEGPASHRQLWDVQSTELLAQDRSYRVLGGFSGLLPSGEHLARDCGSHLRLHKLGVSLLVVAPRARLRIAPTLDHFVHCR